MNQPRNLSATAATCDYEVERHEGLARWAIERALDDPPYAVPLLHVPSHLARGLMQRYGRGDAIASLRDHFNGDYRAMLRQAADLSARFFPEHRLRLHFEQSASWMLLFALVCFDEDGAGMARLDDWITPDCTPVLYAMIRKAFTPDDTYVREPDPKDKAMPGEEQLVGILLQPPSTWPEAFAAYMKQWPKLMKPHGYREHVIEGKVAFDEVPFPLGLAVCAFDVDDSAFRHLPYYPRDLVDYYRTHVRHTRDAWRTQVSDPAAGLPDRARPQPKKTYVLSKTDAYARWVDLVCGERPEMIAAARKALGKRKTMPELETVMEALASVRLGIAADLKDDATVADQATALCGTWQLPALPLPAGEEHGPARIGVILEALHDFALDHGAMLHVLGEGGDNWYAVLCGRAHEAEFATLCEQLRVPVMAREAWA